MSEYLLRTFFECEQKISEIKQVQPDSPRIDYWEDIKTWVTHKMAAFDKMNVRDNEPQQPAIQPAFISTKKHKKPKHKNQYGVRPSLRFKILKRDNYSCQICGKTSVDGVKLEVDHKIPKSQGGTNSLENLWTLCFDCNRGKGTKLL